jgi:hypothetical protein
LSEVLLTAFREFTKTAYKGSVTQLSMATLTLHNYQKMCNGYLGLLLEWSHDYPNDPFYAPAHGSIRLETRFSIRRGQCESFGLLDLVNHQLRDLAVSCLAANGDIKHQKNNKGYVSCEERDMAPTAYSFTPKPLLKSVMVDADATARSFLRVLGMEATGKPTKVVAVEKVVELSVTVNPSSTDTDASESALLAVEDEVDALMLLGDVAGAAKQAETALVILGQVASETTPAPAPDQDPTHLEESAQLVAATVAARELETGRCRPRGRGGRGAAGGRTAEGSVQDRACRAWCWGSLRVLSAGDATQECTAGTAG